MIAIILTENGSNGMLPFHKHMEAEQYIGLNHMKIIILGS
jgi:hypothetical protein